MAHFRGTIQGSRGEASRLGGKGAGLHSHLASWQGAVITELYYNEKAGCDYVRISFTTHCGVGTNRKIYEGPVSGAEPEVKVEDSKWRTR